MYISLQPNDLDKILFMSIGLYLVERIIKTMPKYASKVA